MNRYPADAVAIYSLETGIVETSAEGLGRTSTWGRFDTAVPSAATGDSLGADLERIRSLTRHTTAASRTEPGRQPSKLRRRL